MRVLVACEFSGRVRDAFRAKGHDAWSCDIEDCEGDPTYHIKDDALVVIHDKWDLLIAHPPCDRLCNAGVRWLHERDLWKELDESCRFFLELLNAPIPKIAVENPVPHKYAIERIGRTYDQKIQPWQYGEPETKGVCLWLKNLPLLKPTNIVATRRPRSHMMPDSLHRKRSRSRTHLGIAWAMAEQWS